MAFSPSLDFLALFRPSAGKAAVGTVPPIDGVLSILAAAGVIRLDVGPAAPTAQQAKTMWLKPASAGSWTGNGVLYLWDAATGEYAGATPELLKAYLAAQ